MQRKKTDPLDLKYVSMEPILIYLFKKKKRCLQHRGHEIVLISLHGPQNIPIFSHSISNAKFDGFENPSKKIDGFGRTHRTHADGATDLIQGIA